MLHPGKNPDDAGRLVSHWCNPERAEKPSLGELLLLMHKGHELGIHLFMGFLANEVGYAAPVPVNPDDQQAELQREFLTGLDRLEQLAARLKR